MANKTDTNPMVIDTAATLWTAEPRAATFSLGGRRIRQIQWIDDAADIANDDDLVIAINGATITAKIAMTVDTVCNLAVWTLGPFNPGIHVHTFIVTTIDHGSLLVFLD